jgi:hypothetical protein
VNGFSQSRLVIRLDHDAANRGHSSRWLQAFAWKAIDKPPYRNAGVHADH